MKKLYKLPPMGEEKRTISGGYTPIERSYIQYKDRQLLLILGTACLDGSCCGYSNWNYIQVVGYVSSPSEMEGKSSADSIWIDTVENPEDQKAVRQLLTEKYPNSRIEFE